MARKTFPLTEAGDAEHFGQVFGSRVRFDHRRGRWLIFSGHRWVPDGDGEVHRLGLEAMRLRQQQALQVKDSARRKRAIRWAIAGESRRRIENMLVLTKTISPISDNGDGWDSDPWLLGVRNGVLNLRTGRLRAGRPSDRMTMSTSTAYDSAATCPRWEAAVRQVFNGDRKVLDYVQRALGYSLTGVTKEQCLFMNWGSGANGKGTLLNTVAMVLGDYADDLPFSALELHERSGIPNDIAKLVGKRFVTSSETSDEIRLNEARIKAITGCDPITARFLHREFFTFQPAAKFWLSTNHKPGVQDSSHGFWRRLRLIPFTQQFAGRRDNKNLKETLAAEAPGILRWLVEGCRAWRRKGLEPPKAVTAATEQYRVESDSLAAFLVCRTVVDKNAHVRAGKLYDAYKVWCRQRGEEAITQKKVGRQIRLRFRAEERSHIVSYHGLRLRKVRTDPSTLRDPLSKSSPRRKPIENKPDKRVQKGRRARSTPGVRRARAAGVAASASYSSRIRGAEA